MKKILCAVIIAMLTVSLAACGRGNQVTTVPTTTPATAAPTTMPATVDTLPTMETNIPDPDINTSMPDSTGDATEDFRDPTDTTGAGRSRRGMFR